MKHCVENNETVIDYITGKPKANSGAETNRQTVERLLVEIKGYEPEDIEVDALIMLDMGGEVYQSTVDLVIRVHKVRFMAIKCAPGALASREREIIAAARLMENYQIPLAVATDGKNAIVWDTVTGKCLGEGLGAVPARQQALEDFDAASLVPIDEGRRFRQQLIYKSYDSMYVNRSGER